MDHDYELSVYDRRHTLYDKEKLMRPVSYYASIRPTNYAAEEKARKDAAAAKAAAKAASPTPPPS
jgi:NADH-quinone oxidoreductase subunit I